MGKIGFLNRIKLKRHLKEDGVILCFLFGSFARQEEHAESDVDVAVLFDRKVKKEDFLQKEGKIIAVFSQIFPGREINVVNLSIASPLLRQNAIMEGELIFAKSEDDRILFQIDTLHEYEEYRHLSDIYNFVLNKKIKAL